MDTHERSKTKNFNAELKLKGFAVYEIDNLNAAGYSYSRKDFYKVNLTTGSLSFTTLIKVLKQTRHFCFVRTHTFLTHVSHLGQILQVTPVFFRKSF
jgi:hypothetical protein